jgi:DNA-binding GntR family transcriptional regulator
MMKITPPVSRYQQVADQLRDAILRGEYQPGQALPSEAQLSREYELSRPTVRNAIALLQAEGLVDVEHGRGMFVRSRPPRRLVTRSRHVYRDERGYYFDPQAASWVAVQSPSVGYGPAPDDIARLLRIATGAEVLIRDRQMGEPDGPALQLATSYLRAELVRGTQLEQVDTGPGGIYDRLEEMGHMLHWHETISARMPLPAEIRALSLSPGTPLLRILRVAFNQDDEPLEVNDTRMSADLFEIGYRLEKGNAE